MRTIVLLPLTALVAAVAGCGSQAREPAAPSVPQRDLTLVTQTAAVQIASSVEMEQPRVQHRTVRLSPVAARAPRSRASTPRVVLTSLVVPEPALPVAQPAGPAAAPDNGRELLPGKTVTVIPASSGPSTGSDTADELPPARGHTIAARGGGTCRGGGRGPGAAPAPRPDFRRTARSS